MRLGGQAAGHLTLFIDSSCEEVLLKVLVGDDGSALVAFTLYDSLGRLVIDSPEPAAFPKGLCVRSLDNEILLDIPAHEDEPIAYRLYSHRGQLLTASDGRRTQIFAFLRMAGKTVAPIGARGRPRTLTADEKELGPVPETNE